MKQAREVLKLNPMHYVSKLKNGEIRCQCWECDHITVHTIWKKEQNDNGRHKWIYSIKCNKCDIVGFGYNTNVHQEMDMSHDGVNGVNGVQYQDGEGLWRCLRCHCLLEEEGCESKKYAYLKQ